MVKICCQSVKRACQNKRLVTVTDRQTASDSELIIPSIPHSLQNKHKDLYTIMTEQKAPVVKNIIHAGQKYVPIANGSKVRLVW